MFNITFEIVTHESAEHGEAAESGFVGTGLTLREAADALRGWGWAHSANVWPLGDGSSIRWLTFGGEGFDQHGECESRSLHIVGRVTASSRLRIARLFGLVD